MWARIYAFGFLSSLYLDQFLWFVYLLHLGYSPAFIGLQYAVMQAGRLVLDVPSSMFADRYGSRGVLAAGAAAKLLAAALFFLAARGAAYVLSGALLTAVALTLPSGVDLSYVRSLAEHGKDAVDESAVTRRFADYVGMQRLASLGSGVAGGLIAGASFAWLYAAEGIGSLFMLICAWTLPQAPVHPSRESARPVGPLAAVRELGRPTRAVVSGIGLAAAMLWALSSVGTEYSQALLAGLTLRPFTISIVFAAAGLVMWLATLVAARLGQAARDRLLGLAIWGYPLAAALRGAAWPGTAWAVPLAAGGLTLGRGASGAASMLLEQRLLDAAPRRHRATTLSAVNTVQMGLQLLLFPLLGILSARRRVPAIFLVLTVGLTSACLALTAALRRATAGRRSLVALTGRGDTMTEGNGADIENE